MQHKFSRIILNILLLLMLLAASHSSVSAYPGSNSESPQSRLRFLWSASDLFLQAAEETQVFSFIVTSTPNPDGIIIHTVRYGETLWTISQAYGVPIDEILRNSGLHPTRTDVFEGQELLIQPANGDVPVMIDTITPEFEPDPTTPTPTATQPRPTMTPFPTRTPGPTLTPISPPSMVLRTLGDGKNVGIGLILISGLGLMLVVYMGFLKKP